MATALSRMSLTSSTERASAKARQAASYRANWPSYCAAEDARLLWPADLFGSKYACRAPPSPPAEFAFVGGTAHTRSLDACHLRLLPTVTPMRRSEIWVTIGPLPALSSRRPV